MLTIFVPMPRDLAKAARDVRRRVGRSARILLGRERTPWDLDVFEDDIFLVSYPKSGNTWLRFLLGNLIAPGVSFATLEQTVADIHQNSNAQLSALPRPRLLKSHLPYEPRYRRAAVIVRDPRDVAVSYYHHKIKFREISPSMSIGEFTEQFVAGRVDSYGPWGAHIGSWIGARQGDPGFVIVRYEDLFTRPRDELARVADALGIAADADAIARSVDDSSADRMRALERTGGDRWKALRGTRGDLPFVRAARPGGWRDELPPPAAAAVAEHFARHMFALGYS